MKHTCALTAVFAAVCLAGCSVLPKIHSQGTPASESAPRATVDLTAAAAARSIRLCRTQLSELRQQLGEATRDGIMHKQRIVSWTLPGSSQTRTLAVLLNAQETVVDVYWNQPLEVPWTPADQCLMP